MKVNTPFTLGGMRIMISPHIKPTPRVQCSIDYPGTESGKAAMNAWLLERFGVKHVAYVVDPRFLGMLGDKVIVTSTADAAVIKGLLDAETIR